MFAIPTSHQGRQMFDLSLVFELHMPQGIVRAHLIGLDVDYVASASATRVVLSSPTQIQRTEITACVP